MPNRNRQKGDRKERKIMNQYRAEGKLVTRSAGSQGVWDLTVVDTSAKKIYLLQCKPEQFRDSERLKILMSYPDLSGTYEVYFEVV